MDTTLFAHFSGFETSGTLKSALGANSSISNEASAVGTQQGSMEATALVRLMNPQIAGSTDGKIKKKTTLVCRP